MTEKDLSHFRNLSSQLHKINLYQPLYSLMNHLEKMLPDFTSEKIKLLQEIIENNIERYYEEEIGRKINELEELYEYGNYVDEYGDWHNEYSQYFEVVNKYGCTVPDIIAIKNDFDIPTRDEFDDYDSLLWLLDIGDFENEVNAMDYEIMAVQAITYIEKLIEQPNEIIHLSNAFLAFREAERMEMEFNHKGELLVAEAKAKKKIIEKAKKARHQENRRMKDLVIRKWKTYKQQRIEKGKSASKNEFAQKIYEELENAHNKHPKENRSYSFKTIRNNWLQGID